MSGRTRAGDDPDHPTTRRSGRGQVAEETEREPQVTIDPAAERARPRLIALLLCDYLNQTAEKKYNLMGTFDRIVVDAEKRTTPNFMLYVRTNHIGLGEMQVVIFGPSNAVVGGMLTEVRRQEDVPDDAPEVLQFALQVQFTVEEPGEHWIDISHNGVSIGGAPLTIEYRSEETK
jgi:hypothetical protein